MLVCTDLRAQTSENQTEGTFQLYSTNIKSSQVFTTELFTTIEQNRAQNEDVMLQIGEHNWVKILSFNTISDPNFIPLSTEVLELEIDSIPENPTK